MQRLITDFLSRDKKKSKIKLNTYDYLIISFRQIACVAHEGMIKTVPEHIPNDYFNQSVFIIIFDL